MTGILKTAYVCNFIGTIFFSLTGLMYMRRKKFMPYHSDALGQTWDELEPQQQVMFIASMKMVGAAWFATAVSQFVVLKIAFKGGMTWATFSVPAVGLLLALPTLRATLRVRKETPARPPWPSVAIAALLYLTALILAFIANRSVA